MDARELVRHAAFLRSLARGLLGDEHLAEDAVQDAYAAAIRARGVRDPRAWLVSVTKNLSRKAFGREEGRKRAERISARRERLPSARELAAQAEAQRRVARAVVELEEPYRAAVLLRYFHHRTPTEIARQSGEPLATVKTRLRRALQMLRARMDADHGGERAAWSVALLPLAGRGRDSVPLLLGGLAVFKTKIIAAAILVAALVTLLATRASRRGPDAETAARASRPVAAVEPEPGPDRAPPPPEGRIAEAEDAVAAAAGSDRMRYGAERRAAKLVGEVRDMQRSVREMGLSEPEEPAPDPATRAYLEALIEKYRGLPEGEERLLVLREFASAHKDYLEATHDVTLLAFLEQVIRTSPVADERAYAVPGGGVFGVADLLFRLADVDDDIVRAAVVRSLAEVEGEERPRAIALLVEALEDESPEVRWVAALRLEYFVGDRRHADALLDRIPREEDPCAMDAMVKAVVALDPEHGRARVEAAVSEAPATVRGLAADALRPEVSVAPARPKETAGFAESRKGMTPRPTEPDDTARDYVERLLREYRALGPGSARTKALENLAKAHRGYLEKTGDDSFLPALREIASSSPVEEERVSAVRAVGTAPSRSRAVDFLLDLAASPDAAVRGAVATALGWVRGPEVERARARLLEMIDDPAPRVRRVIPFLLRDPAHVPLLLEKLRSETDFSVAWAMVQAVLKLDPEGGREAIDEVRATAPAASRAVIDRVLERR